VAAIATGPIVHVSIATASAAVVSWQGRLSRMADGSIRPIEDVKVGDEVLAYDEASGATKHARVGTAYAPRSVDGYYVINGVVTATGSQPVLSDGKWITVSALKVGNTLTAQDGKTIPITSMKAAKDKVTGHRHQAARDSRIETPWFGELPGAGSAARTFRVQSGGGD
jgi:hypothetical protein